MGTIPSSGSTTSVDASESAETAPSPAAPPSPDDAETAQFPASAGPTGTPAEAPAPPDGGTAPADGAPPVEPAVTAAAEGAVPPAETPASAEAASDAEPGAVAETAVETAPTDATASAAEPETVADDGAVATAPEPDAAAPAATAPAEGAPADPAPADAAPAGPHRADLPPDDTATTDAAVPTSAPAATAEADAASPGAASPDTASGETASDAAAPSGASPQGGAGQEDGPTGAEQPASPESAEAPEGGAAAASDTGTPTGPPPEAGTEPPAPAGPPPNWAETRAEQLIAAVAGDTKWAEERGKAADAQAVEYWLELAAAAAARGKHSSDETVEAPRVQPTKRRRAPGAPLSAPPPAPTPRRLAGSTVVKPKYSRFGARLILTSILALAIVVALVVGGITLLTRAQRSTAAAPRVPAAQLPVLGDAKPVLAALSQSAPAPDPATLAGKLGPLLAAPALGSSTHTEVLDVATGKVLLDSDAQTPGAPASTAKLLTATAALTTLDPADTIPTKVVAGADPGEVVLVGGGDPTLSRTVPSQSYPGAATMADLAGQVTKALPPGTKITRIVVDTSVFSGSNTGPGWQPDDAPSNYAAPVTAVAVDGGRVSASSQFRSGSPATDAGRALADALGARGAPVVLGQAPAGAKELGIVHSAPIARLVEQALSMSDNVLAEALARQVAIARHQPASFEGAASSVMAAVKDAGIDTTGVQMLDGSGLSRQDRVPPRVLADLIAGAAAGKLGTASDLLSGLPVAGYDGTLADRGDADPSTAPGSVRAKTGTLLGVSALAGTVVTADGRLLAFAILADGVPGSVNAAEKALDDVARTLAGCGCR